MFDIAWSEFMLIGAVALVVIGPKDLPKALRTAGQAIGRIRRMAGEFQTQFNDAMREAELDELKKQVEDVGGSVQSSVSSDFKPIGQINEFGAPKPADEASRTAADEASLKEAEAKLAALPAPEPLPEVAIAPSPVAEPAPEPGADPEAKPEVKKAPRKRAAKPKAAAVADPGEGSPA